MWAYQTDAVLQPEPQGARALTVHPRKCYYYRKLEVRRRYTWMNVAQSYLLIPTCGVEGSCVLFWRISRMLVQIILCQLISIKMQ